MKTENEIVSKLIKFYGLNPDFYMDRDIILKIRTAVKLGYIEGVNFGVTEFKELELPTIKKIGDKYWKC